MGRVPVDGRPDHHEGAQYELVAGERRFRCAQRLGWDTIPAMVRPTDDIDLLSDALLENIHRAALNPLEEAAAYQQLLRTSGARRTSSQHGWDAPVRRSPTPSGCCAFPRACSGGSRPGCCPRDTLERFLSLPDDARMEALASRIVAEGLSVRTVEEIVTLGDGPTRACDHVARAGPPPMTACRTGRRARGSSGHPGPDDHGQGQGTGHDRVRRGGRTWRGSSTCSASRGHRPRTVVAGSVPGGTRRSRCGQPSRRWPWSRPRIRP